MLEDDGFAAKSIIDARKHRMSAAIAAEIARNSKRQNAMSLEREKNLCIKGNKTICLTQSHLPDSRRPTLPSFRFEQQFLATRQEHVRQAETEAHAVRRQLVRLWLAVMFHV